MFHKAVAYHSNRKVSGLNEVHRWKSLIVETDERRPRIGGDARVIDRSALGRSIHVASLSPFIPWSILHNTYQLEKANKTKYMRRRISLRMTDTWVPI